LGRLSRIGGDIEKVLDGIARIERLVQHIDAGETTRRYEADYRQAVQRNLDYLELFGADISPEAQRHSLSVGYVSLNLTSSTAGRTPATLSVDSLILLLADRPGRLLLRGDAGSGKSTLLRWLAIETASGRQLQWLTLRNWLVVQASRRRITAGEGITSNHPSPYLSQKELADISRYLFDISSDPNFNFDIPSEADLALAQQIFDNARIPFLIRLRDCNNGTLPAPEDLPPLIANELGRPPVDWVKSVLDEGNGLLLFDGVDEVPNQRRETVRGGLEALIGRYPKNQFVVTTRPAAVPEGWLTSGGFAEALINPMSPPDRAEFIRRWHAAVSDELLRQGRPENLSPLADELIAKLSDSPAIARLATNPLLGAALCALHRDRHRKLPESQSELCEALCQLLLHRRETQAGLNLSEFPREYSDLTYEQKRAIVQGIAHYMVRNEDSVISDTDALAETREALARFPSGRQGDAPVVLRALIERSGVLREQRPHAIDFVHNTIKEFLAAEVFVEHRDVATLARRALDDAWKQVVLFASATRQRASSRE
jgi:predicted NACHT family NTPase